MDPSVYVPLYLEHAYAIEHPELTSAARELLRDEVRHHPENYATTLHAKALISYERVHSHMLRELERMEMLADDEFERQRAELFDETRRNLIDIWQTDPLCTDARLLDILLANVPLDNCLMDLVALERDAREQLMRGNAAFDPDADFFWRGSSAPEAAALTSTNPQVIGWLHIVEALSEGSLASGRYRAAVSYARIVARAQGHPNYAVGTLLLALARLEDEEGFFACLRDASPELEVESSPWYLLGRTLLLYKLGRLRSARRALRDFSARCDGGAFFLLNPTYLTPYLPVRPATKRDWERTHQAVWEADGIIVDTPDFVAWAEGVDGIMDASERFASRNGF